MVNVGETIGTVVNVTFPIVIFALVIVLGVGSQDGLWQCRPLAGEEYRVHVFRTMDVKKKGRMRECSDVKDFDSGANCRVQQGFFVTGLLLLALFDLAWYKFVYKAQRYIVNYNSVAMGLLTGAAVCFLTVGISAYNTVPRTCNSGQDADVAVVIFSLILGFLCVHVGQHRDEAQHP